MGGPRTLERREAHGRGPRLRMTVAGPSFTAARWAAAARPSRGGPLLLCAHKHAAHQSTIRAALKMDQMQPRRAKVPATCRTSRRSRTQTPSMPQMRRRQQHLVISERRDRLCMPCSLLPCGKGPEGRHRIAMPRNLSRRRQKEERGTSCTRTRCYASALCISWCHARLPRVPLSRPVYVPAACCCHPTNPTPGRPIAASSSFARALCCAAVPPASPAAALQPKGDGRARGVEAGVTTRPKCDANAAQGRITTAALLVWGPCRQHLSGTSALGPRCHWRSSLCAFRLCPRLSGLPS
jgi:hypothetical protein